MAFVCLAVWGDSSKTQAAPLEAKCFQDLTSRMFSSHFSSLLYAGLQKPNLTLLLIASQLSCTIQTAYKFCCDVEFSSPTKCTMAVSSIEVCTLMLKGQITCICSSRQLNGYGIEINHNDNAVEGRSSEFFTLLLKEDRDRVGRDGLTCLAMQVGHLVDKLKNSAQNISRASVCRTVLLYFFFLCVF